MDDTNGQPTVLDALRGYYFHIEAIILHASEHATDSNVLARIADDLDEYAAMVEEVSAVYLSYRIYRDLNKVSNISFFHWTNCPHSDPILPLCDQIFESYMINL